MRLSEFLRDVYVPEHDLLPGSVRQLRMSIAAFSELVGDLSIDSVSHAHLNQMASENRRSWKPRTLKRRILDVLAVWTYAYRIGMTDNRPDRLRIRCIRVPRREPQAWTLDELKRMYDAAGQFRRFLHNGVREGSLLRSTLLVGFHSALRAADLMRILRSELAPIGCAVPQQKKRGAEVIVRVPSEVIDYVDSEYPDDVSKVFAWPYRREHFYARLWHRMLNAAGLPCGREHGLQRLRRTAITHAEAMHAGWGAKLAGHEPGSRVTWASYIDKRLLPDHEIKLPNILG